MAASSEGIREIEGYLAIARAVARNKSKKARAMAVGRLLKQADNDEELDALFEKIRLKELINEPQKLSDNLKDIDAFLANKIADKYKVKPELEPIKFNQEVIKKISESNLNPRELNALKIVKQYHVVAQKLEAIKSQIPERIQEEEYKKLNDKIDGLNRELIALREGAEAESLSGINHPILRDSLYQISRISKESSSTEEIKKPESLDELKLKTLPRPC